LDDFELLENKFDRFLQVLRARRALLH
jgi:hypothetical protein